MKKRDFTDMVIFFCQKVSEMNISQKYRLELLGMITAIEMKHDELMPKWIPVTEALPEEKGEYLVSYHPCHWNTVSEKVVVGMDTFRGKTTWAKMKYQKVIAWMPLPEPWKGE